MPLFSLDELKSALDIVRPFVLETPSINWPLLSQTVGVDVVVKHENHTPAGAFKIRGGLVYMEELMQRAATSGALPKGVVAATRGNHGQSVAFAASRHNLPSIIVVPEGNSVEKNAAMLAFGAELVIAGKDFDESRIVAAELQKDKDYHQVPSFHPALVKGVATYAYELFTRHPKLDVIYAPIGMGSGICGLITVRDLLGLETEIVGVVSENAPAMELSFQSGQLTETEHALTFADGVATRCPSPAAFDIILNGAARIITVSEEQIGEAMRLYYTTIHNIAEGAAGVPLAGLLSEKAMLEGKTAGVILSGGNIDLSMFRTVLEGKTPIVG